MIIRRPCLSVHFSTLLVFLLHHHRGGPLPPRTVPSPDGRTSLRMLYCCVSGSDAQRLVFVVEQERPLQAGRPPQGRHGLQILLGNRKQGNSTLV